LGAPSAWAARNRACRFYANTFTKTGTDEGAEVETEIPFMKGYRER
jgi:antirestriction protein ArdC